MFQGLGFGVHRVLRMLLEAGGAQLQIPFEAFFAPAALKGNSKPFKPRTLDTRKPALKPKPP